MQTLAATVPVALQLAIVNKAGAPEAGRLLACLHTPYTPQAARALLEAWNAEGDALATFPAKALDTVVSAFAKEEPARYVAVSDVHYGDKVLFLKSPHVSEWIAFDAQGRLDLYADVDSVASALEGRHNVDWIIGNVIMVSHDPRDPPNVRRAIFASKK